MKRFLVIAATGPYVFESKIEYAQFCKSHHGANIQEIRGNDLHPVRGF